jgi:hypothetical protein
MCWPQRLGHRGRAVTIYGGEQDPQREARPNPTCIVSTLYLGVAILPSRVSSHNVKELARAVLALQASMGKMVQI